MRILIACCVVLLLACPGNPPAPTDGALQAKKAPGFRAESSLEGDDTVRLRLRSSKKLTLERQNADSDKAETVELMAAGSDAFEAVLQTSGNVGSTLLIASVEGGAAWPIEWTWAKVAPGAEVDAADGAMRFDLTALPEGARVSVVSLPGGSGSLSGPVQVSASAAATVEATFSLPISPQRKALPGIEVLRRDATGKLSTVPSTVHADLGRVFFRAELPGTFYVTQRTP